MSLEGLVLGLVALVVGAAFTFWGYRFFLILLPLWGFLFGFLAGADLTTYVFGNGFLSTAFSWIAGFVFGLICAALSYLYYWFAVVWVGATAGYALGIGVMGWLTPNLDIFSFVVAIVVAAAFGLAMIVLKVPKFLVLLVTAFGGAFAVIAGIALMLGRVPPEMLQYGTVGEYIKDGLSWLWVAAAILLGIAGFFSQWLTSNGQAFVSEGDYRNPGLQTSGGTGGAVPPRAF